MQQNFMPAVKLSFTVPDSTTKAKAQLLICNDMEEVTKQTNDIVQYTIDYHMTKNGLMFECLVVCRTNAAQEAIRQHKFAEELGTVYKRNSFTFLTTLNRPYQKGVKVNGIKDGKPAKAKDADRIA